MKIQVSDQAVATVYKTKDYSKFKTITGNRSVDERRINRIMKSIEAVGIRMVPIVVNSRFEVIDGQGRLAALKKLGRPVLYVMDRDAGIEECRWLNIGCENWKNPDWIKSYAERGVSEYEILYRLFNEFKGVLSLNIICAAAKGLHGRVATQENIRGGKFKIVFSEEEIRDKLQYLAKFVPKVKQLGGKADEFYLALLFAIDQKGVDRKRLFDKFLTIDVEAERGLRGSVLGNVRMINEFYNKQLYQKNRIDIYNLFYYGEHRNKLNHRKSESNH